MMIANAEPAEHSIQRYLLAGTTLALLLTFGIGGWAATTELSSAVIAQGTLVVDSSVKKVQHPTGGVVSELRVRNGDRVRAGDILLRLDETQTRAAATIITKNVDELLARQARLDGVVANGLTHQPGAAAADQADVEAVADARAVGAPRRDAQLAGLEPREIEQRGDHAVQP